MSKTKLNDKRVLKRAARRAAPKPATDVPVVDAFATAMDGTFDPNDVGGAAISFFSDHTLKIGRKHVETIRNAVVAQQQQLVSREDRRRLSVMVLYSIVELGKLSLASKAKHADAGALGGKNKGTGGGARMPTSKKALGEVLDLTHRNLTEAEIIAQNLWAVEQVISDSKSTRADAKPSQVLNLINAKKKSMEPATVTDYIREAIKAQRNSNGYYGSIYADWDDAPESKRQELLETMRECSDNYTRLLKRQNSKVA
jgi:hypothetical protein